MKVAIFKSYEKSEEVSYNYGDTIEVVSKRFNVIEEIKEMHVEEIEVLKKAISIFNNKKVSVYSMGCFVLIDDIELDKLMSDYNTHQSIEESKIEKQRIAYIEKLKAAKKIKEEKKEANKEKKEAIKKKRAIEKIAEQLNVSEDDVLVMLANRKK